MYSSHLRALSLLTLSALSVAPCARADDSAHSAPEISAAESYANQAFDAYEAKDFARAVALYRQAYDAAPSADILYNMARIYDAGLRDRPLAITYYRRYVSDPGATAERIQLANERLTQLRDAEDVSAKTAGTTDVRSDDEDAQQGQRRSDEPRAAPKQPGTTLRRTGIATGVVGVAALATGAGLGMWAKSDADLADTYCDGNACTSQRGIDAVDSGELKATVSTAALVGGGVLVATGVTLFIVGTRRGTAHTQTHARIQWSPLASSSQLGAVISGKW